jgi:hypothetical protein
MKNTKMPNGHGRLYKSDKSLYIGEFVKGKASGGGSMIFGDGSFY